MGLESILRCAPPKLKAMHNAYQKMHYESLYGSKAQPKKPKQYALYENGIAGNPAPYALLQHQKKERIKQGIPGYLLKIKEVRK